MYLDILCMYCTRIPKESKIHIRYIKIHVYLARFLGVTLDTYQDTSGYVYPGLFITIHQDTPRYKITIHVSCILDGIHAGNNPKCIQRGTNVSREARI
jgi:hypothetical protein